MQLEQWQSIDTKTFPERNGELKKTVAVAGIKNRQKKGGGKKLVWRLPFTFHALDLPLLTNQVPQPKRRNMMKNIYRFALMLVVAMFVIGSTGCAKKEEAPKKEEKKK
ncbi:MAG: hypothetical protein QF773_04050 [Lentisphaeria bacterium]|nr:hypothetical protein [Lentisphaeria bacterium]